jgi:hypothetical protein
MSEGSYDTPMASAHESDPAPERGGPVFTALPTDAFPANENAGGSTCPICKRTWLVTPWDDCFLPSCGCYGTDASTGDRPCESCGMAHRRQHAPGQDSSTAKGRRSDDE